MTMENIELPFAEKIKTIQMQPAGRTTPRVVVDRVADTKTVEVIPESGVRLGGNHTHHADGSVDAHVVTPTTVADLSAGQLS